MTVLDLFEDFKIPAHFGAELHAHFHRIFHDRALGQLYFVHRKYVI